MHMVKVISLSEEAYKILKHSKKTNMSFSDVIVQYAGLTQGYKTENINDLLLWTKNLKQIGKKLKISQNVDQIVYGEKR